MEYESLFFARAHEHEKQERVANKTLEFMWEASENAPALFTHIFRNHYNYPSNFNIFNPAYTLVADKTSPVYNAANGYNEMKRHLDTYRHNYNSSHLMVLFGDDFMWENAQMSFWQLDQLIIEGDEQN